MRIAVGELKDGWMSIRDEILLEVVYKVDARVDLVLIRLSSVPSGSNGVPMIPLANEFPPAGADCIAIGHPAA